MNDPIIINASVPAALTDNAVVARIASWSADAEGAYSPETFRAWRNDWKAFSAWCAAAQLCPLPAEAATVARYVREESAAGRAVATIRRRLATIARAHRSGGLSNPVEAEAVRLAMRAIAQERGTDQKQAAPLTERDADKIVARVDTDAARPKDARDLALLLTGRDLMARSSELVGLTCGAVTFDDDDTATINMRRGKTSTETLPLHIGADAAAALRRWIEISGLKDAPAETPVFQGLTKGGKLTGCALLPGDVGRVLKALGARAKLDQAFSGHSLRVGMTSDMVAEGVDGAAIMQAAGWSTPQMLTRYTRKLSAKRGAVAQYYARRHK